MKKIPVGKYGGIFKPSRKLSTFLASALACISLLMIPFSQSQAFTFKIATISPEGATWMVKMREGANSIKKLTNNRVIFKFYPGGVMGNDKSVLRKIRIGQLHGGALTGGTFAELYPDTQLYALPFLFNSFKEVNYIRERMDNELIKGLEDRGFVNFGFAEGGFAYLMSNKPLRNVNDVQQQKVWIPSGDIIGKIVFETAKVSPIPLPLSDVMTSLQTGLINTLAASPIGAIALQWHTRIKYVMDTPLSYFYALLAIDKKAFDEINVDDQVIVRDVMVNTFKEIDKQNREDNINAKKALKNQGIDFITLTDQTLSDWQTVGKDAQKTLINRGIYSTEAMQTLKMHLQTFRQSSAQKAQSMTKR